MTWGLGILLLIVFISFSVVLFLVYPELSKYFELYFIGVIIILFIILIFAIDFDNPISTTIYLERLAADRTLTFEVPYNDNTQFSNLMSVSFTGVYSPDNSPVNSTAYTNNVVFNYDEIDENGATILNGQIKVTRLPDYELKLEIIPSEGVVLDGFLTMSLLCTGSQNINGKFKRL
jgi:hypothetical protein